MNPIRKRVKKRLDRLAESDRTLEAIYGILFDQNETLVMGEIPTMTKKLFYTYREAAADIDALAFSLAWRMGKTDCYIGLYGENSPRWITAFWAILKSGNKPYLVNLRQPASFSEEMLVTLGAEVVVFCDGATPLAYPAFSYETLLEEGRGKGLPAGPFADEFVLSTSGTTLKKKLCFYSGKEMAAELLNTASVVEENPTIVASYKGGFRVLSFLPLYHIFGFAVTYLWFSFLGATQVFLPDLVPENILRTVRVHKVTHIFAVPLLFHSIEKSLRAALNAKDAKTKKRFQKALARSLRLQNISPRLGMAFAKKAFATVRRRLLGDSVCFMITGGSYIKASTLSLLNGIGYPLYNGYGMTEVGITSVELGKKPKHRLLGAIGKPFDSVSYRIGEDGQLFIKGESLCKRILEDGDEQPRAEWFATGDLATLTPDGRYYIKGRLSDLVFSDDGENLNPDLAEAAFTLPYVKHFSVLGSADNSRLVLIVEIAEGLLALQKNAILRAIETANASLVPAYRVREVYFTHDPIQAKGAIKVSRAYLLREIDEGRVRLFSLKTKEEAPAETGEESEVKRILRSMLAACLGLEENEIPDKAHIMLDLGATSLDYFALVGEINRRFDVELRFEEEGFGYSLADLERVIQTMIG